MDDKEKEDEEENAAAVAAFVRQEVPDWDDESTSRARFKALSGQRSDWDPLYRFWRDLIVKVARHRRIFIIRPSAVSRLWFRRADGLSPLCLDRVLIEMLRAGDLSPPPSPHPTSAATRLSHIFRRALGFFGASNDDDENSPLAGDSYILAPLLEERALEVIGKLSENHWTNSCVITMKKFQDICMGSEQALAILSYLSAQGKAARLIINRVDPIEGVKICLSHGAVCAASSSDYSVLHLVWTAEKLEQQLDLIDQRYQKSRNSALASLKSGNKKIALRYAKELKLTTQSRERCTSLLDRVEEVLQVITDAESSKKVSEAIKGSAHAIRENRISIEEVELCLQEVDENIDSLKQLDNALESSTSYAEVDDEDIEDEFNKLQLEIGIETNQLPTKNGFNSNASEETDALSNALSNLNLKNSAEIDSPAEYHLKSGGNKSMSKEEGCLEAA
ncbi:hypothetical protein ABFS82_04G148200 [Erythranthe guttata]|uniref:Charged multivesicular body protein 7 n=1 Tax=Erythranthe guttata TaxID=4155 RepID=A0A022Q4G9_ERYGU|nr:PREDICTED: charged multivesicular body protein 7 [Erythranthe guttata]EYU23567.1 hypothetical protein MIMGU_mgv1a006332mg [Erythranthe guttata]|eukprot:XP_012854052.1 PREDICTED: charged multivesicular body protein 7 [Erythranthe guttata]